MSNIFVSGLLHDHILLTSAKSGAVTQKFSSFPKTVLERFFF